MVLSIPLREYFCTGLALPMPLIIESYDLPYTRIANLLFPNTRFELVSAPESLDSSDEPYCYTRAEDNPRAVRYYFNRVYYVDNGQIMCVDKTAQKMRVYSLSTGRPVGACAGNRNAKVDKREFLPQLMAQKGEIVPFPDEEDD